MRGYRIERPDGLEALVAVDLPEPTPGPGQIVVEMSAWSLNFRDLSMLSGGYPRNDKTPLIPLSDGCGHVVAVGEGVSRVAVGDRVCPTFFQAWLDGDLTEAHMPSALGGACDGLLAERVLLSDQGVIVPPEHLTDAEAATLPCAAVTAWQALTLGGLQAGQDVLCLGTGGVSIFALQLARAFGARVIITSSDDDKLARAGDLGADVGINYHQRPDWDAAVRDVTSGVGVDNVIEVGGAGTLAKSMNAARVSGTVSLIGVLTGRPDQNPSPLPALFNRLTIRGIYVGSRSMFEAMNRCLAVNEIRPVIDRTFGFETVDEIRAAYQHLQSAAHLGKVVIERT